MTTHDSDPVSSSDDAGSDHVGPDEAPPSGSRQEKRHLPLWQETILLLGVALGLAVLIKAVLLQAFYIPSPSMEPGLVKNDRILVQKVSYWGSGEPQRGDVVVFQDPGGWLSPLDSAGPTSPVARVLAKIGLYPTGGHLVKRVIGVGGDTIECCDKQGRIKVNGVALDEESYVKDDPSISCNGPRPTNCGESWSVGPIPEGKLFVMGDNRGDSADSSEHLCVDTETECTSDPYISVDDVVGKVFVLLWPRDHFRWIERPADFEDIPSP